MVDTLKKNKELIAIAFAIVGAFILLAYNNRINKESDLNNTSNNLTYFIEK